MKQIIKPIGIIFLVIIGIGFYVQTFESIPDNAKILIIENKKVWFPYSSIIQDKMELSIISGELTEGDVIGAIETTYKETRKNGKYYNYNLPKNWETYTESYTTGQSQYLIMSFIWEGTKRWNEDGSWNW